MPRSRPLRRSLGPAAALALALPATASGVPSAVSPLPFADAAATNTLDLATQADGRVALAWTHAVNRAGVGFALRPAAAPFANGIVQDVTGESSGVLGLLQAGGGTPLRLVRTAGSSALVHRLGANGLDGGVLRGSGINGAVAVASCPDGSDALITETTPSAGAQGLVIDQGTGGLFSGWSGAHDDDSFVGLVTICAGSEVSVAVVRDTDLGAGTTDVGSVHTFTAGNEVDRIRLTEPAGGSLGSARVARLPDGRVFLVQEFDDADGTYGVMIATNAAGAASTTTSPFATLDGADLRDVTVDASGRLLVLHDAHAPTSTDDDDPGIPTVASIAAGTSTIVTTPLTATPDDRSRTFQAGHPDGRPRLVTLFNDGDVPPDDDRVLVSGLTGVPGQAADPPVTVRPPSPAGTSASFLRAAYLPSGDLVAAWQASPVRKIFEGGVDTGAPPTLGAVSVPGAVVAGEPVVLEFAPSDPMGLASAGWTTGGTSLPGARVTTTFPTAGTRTVTATATDRAGNTSTTTRTIRILPADAVAPTPPPAPVVVTVPGPSVPTAGTGEVPPPDRRAPRITALSQTPSRLSPRGTVLRMRVRADEAASLDVELVGRVRRGRDRATLVLGTTRVARLTPNRVRTVRLRVRPALVRLVEGRRLQVRAIATDVAGNRRTRTVTVRRRAR